MDILVNSSSSIRCVRQLDFVFDESLHEVVQDVTVEDILKDPREYQRVNVTVKILQITEDRESFTRSHQRMKKRTYDVADKTHSISLCVWGGEILSNDKWYNLTNVSVRQFGGETCISTTAQSKLMMLGDLDIEVAGVVHNYTIFEGQVVTAEVNVDYLCPKQHVVQNVNLTTAITRCPQCGAYCRTASIFALLRSKVSVEDATGKMSDFVIDDFVLRKLLNLGSERFFETDSLVSKLLVQEGIQLTVRGNRVTAAAFLPACAKPTKEMDQVKDSVPTANCSTSAEDDLLLEDFFRNECAEEVNSLDVVNEKETVNIEDDGKGNLTDCGTTEQVVEESEQKEPEASVRPKYGKCDKKFKHSGNTGKKK